MLPITTCDVVLTEHKLRAARADRIGPLVSDFASQTRRPSRGLAARTWIGRVLVSAGTWMQAAPRRVQAAEPRC